MKRSRLLKGSRLFTLYAFYMSSAARSKIKAIRGEESQRESSSLSNGLSHRMSGIGQQDFLRVWCNRIIIII